MPCEVRRIDGVLMTGRNISAAHEAHGSLRVQGAAFAIGQASGAAAAVAALSRRQPRDVDVRKVQDILIEQKANLDLEKSNSFRATA